MYNGYCQMDDRTLKTLKNGGRNHGKYRIFTEKS